MARTVSYAERWRSLAAENWKQARVWLASARLAKAEGDSESVAFFVRMAQHCRTHARYLLGHAEETSSRRSYRTQGYVG